VGRLVRKQKSLERGAEYLKAGKFNEAIIELRNALLVDPDFFLALHALGRAYAAKSWFIDSWRELNRAQKLVPDSVPIAVDLGKALLEIGAFSEAEDQVKFILTRDPDNRHLVLGLLPGESSLISDRRST
jgi:Tfp pilus assembly protein PilF